MFNTTISGNSAGTAGGGIFATAPVALTQATIAFNTTSSDGGGVAVSGLYSHAIANTLIANNRDASGSNAPDVSANFSSSTVQHSLIRSTAGIAGATLKDGVNGNIIGKDPQLGPLQNNGGPTQTHALVNRESCHQYRKNALALDGSGMVASLDQAGNLRIAKGTVDIGAYEQQLDIRPVELPELLPVEFPFCPLTCAPYRNLPTLQALSTEELLLFALVDEIEVRMLNDYSALVLERNDTQPLTLAQSQTLMQDIEQQTGVRPAVLYLTFGRNAFTALTMPNGRAGAIALNETVLNESSFNENPIPGSLPMEPRPFPGSRRTTRLEPTHFPVSLTQSPGLSPLSANEADPLQLLLVTPEGVPIVRRPLGVTRSPGRTTGTSFADGFKSRLE